MSMARKYSIWFISFLLTIDIWEIQQWLLIYANPCQYNFTLTHIHYKKVNFFFWAWIHYGQAARKRIFTNSGNTGEVKPTSWDRRQASFWHQVGPGRPETSSQEALATGPGLQRPRSGGWGLGGGAEFSMHHRNQQAFSWEIGWKCADQHKNFY